MINHDKIGLGTVQFGLNYGISNKTGQTSACEVKRILELARKKGIGVLDSASAYGNAEEVLGQNDLQGFQIVSKFVPPRKGGKISDQLKFSCQNLGLNSIYAYLAHRPMDLLEQPEQWEELKVSRAEGKIQKIGFSLNEPEELEKLLEKELIPDIVQVPYNYLDRRFEDQMEDLKEHGCEIHTRSTFLQGLFFMHPEDVNAFFDQVKPVLLELQKDKDSLPGQLLKFVIQKPFVDRVIIGVETEKQLEKNLKSLETSSDLPELKQIFSDDILIPARWPKK